VRDGAGELNYSSIKVVSRIIKMTQIFSKIGKMREHFGPNQKGSVAVMVALMLPFIVGFVGLGLDIGNLCVIRTQLQSAVDAAVCGGGLKLPDHSQATAQAQSFITNNNFDPSTATITFTQDTVRNPTNYPEINCSMTKSVPTYFMGLFGVKTVSLTASAEGILSSGSVGGPFNYTLFSNLPLALSGSRTVTGSVHSNNGLTMSGSNNTITGAAEGAKGVTISGSNQTIGSVVADTQSDIHISGSNNTIGPLSGGASNIAMPDYTSQIEAIAGQQGTVYSNTKTLSGTNNINGNIYVKGNVTLSGVTTNGTGAILADGNITTSGTTTVGGSGQVCLYSANGNITISGSITNGTGASEIIYAPKGTVSISGNTTIHGSIIANQIVISGSLTIDGNDYPVRTLPGNQHVKLIQ
jgi:cytoskeletal protein CcmA (bactofilin family)